MDQKKKLEGAYAPDKETRKERVVVGLSGGLDSLVSAYLLKIQKYEVFAVTVLPGWDQFPGDKGAVIGCHIGDDKMETIREFCNQLKVPHYFIKASSEFQETVVEEWMAGKVTGTTSNACWSCHGLRMRLLYQKMSDLNAKYLATGHYAKIFHHAAHDTYYVHTSNDEEHDQAALLSRLPSTVLSSLMLPLSDLTKKEVIKLAGNFGIEAKENKVRMHECFPTNEKTIEYLTKRVPKSMALPGEIYNLDGTQMYGEHQGIICNNYGEEARLEKAKSSALYFTSYSMKDRRLLVGDESYFLHQRIQLIDCAFSEEVSWPEPMRAVLQMSRGNYVECWIYPKAQKSAFVEWEGRNWVKEGEILTVLRKKGKNSKVYLTGKVRFLPEDLPKKEDESNPEEKVQQVDYSKDF